MGELKAFRAFVEAVLSPGMTWTPRDKEKAFIPHCNAIVENCDPMVVKGYVADFLMHAIDQGEAMVADFLNHVDRMLDTYTRERHFTSEDIECLCEFLTRFKSADARLTKFSDFVDCLSQADVENFQCLVVGRFGGTTLSDVVDSHRDHIGGIIEVRFQDIQDVMSQHTELLAYARTAQALMQTGTMKPELTAPLQYHLCMYDDGAINLDDDRMRLDKEERDKRRFNDQTRYADDEIKRLGITRTDTSRYDPWSNPDAETVKALKGHCDWLRSMVCSKPAGLPYQLEGLHTRPYMTIILELKTLFVGTSKKDPGRFTREFKLLSDEQCKVQAIKMTNSSYQAIFAHFRAARAIGDYIIQHAKVSDPLIRLIGHWHSCYLFMWSEFDALEKELEERNHPCLSWFKRLRETVYDILTSLIDTHCLGAASRLEAVATAAERAQIVTCTDLVERKKRHILPTDSPENVAILSTPDEDPQRDRTFLRHEARTSLESSLNAHAKIRVKHKVTRHIPPTKAAIDAAMKPFLDQAATPQVRLAPAARVVQSAHARRPLAHTNGLNSHHRAATPVKAAHTKRLNVHKNGVKQGKKAKGSCLVM